MRPSNADPLKADPRSRSFFSPRPPFRCISFLSPACLGKRDHFADQPIIAIPLVQINALPPRNSVTWLGSPEWASRDLQEWSRARYRIDSLNRVRSRKFARAMRTRNDDARSNFVIKANAMPPPAAIPPPCSPPPRRLDPEVRFRRNDREYRMAREVRRKSEMVDCARSN